MLQAYAVFAGIFDDTGVACGHQVHKGLDGVERGDIVGCIDRRKRRYRLCVRTDKRIADLQIASAKTVLAVEPLDNLMDQFARKSCLVERPAFDPGMNFQRATVCDADCRVHHP